MQQEYEKCIKDGVCDIMTCCPIDNTFKIIGKKFTIHILRNMGLLNQNRFNQLLESIEGINPKTLSARLREMEKSGLIERKIIPSTPPRVEYSVTEKGLALKPVILAMAEFSMKYCAGDVFKDGKSRTLKQVFNMALVDIPKEHRR
ncbi:winged helix-turn-helix transcriptional regulator [Candidatus Nitrosotenuis uzonensis]|nr:helix-turn-helix domain-containing protein [Candidatus Nitrosotenuis uzonensis]